MKDLYKRLIDDRNLKMLKRMEKLLQKGNAFIAIVKAKSLCCESNKYTFRKIKNSQTCQVFKT